MPLWGGTPVMQDNVMQHNDTPHPFANVAAVVTGASSGIGQAAAIALAGAGAAKIGIHFRNNEAGAKETAARCKALGANVATFCADLSNQADIDRLADETFETLGTINVWVHNAGADVLTGSAADQSFEDKLRRLLEVDVIGTIALARTVADRMSQQTTNHPSSMVLIGWDQAPLGMEGDAGQMFGPVKAAVMAFSASLAQSVAPKVRVNTVAPGWIKTSWGDTASDYWDRRAKGQALMNRWGSPEDVARAVVFASDPNNTFLTGQTIEVNGGWNRKFDVR